LRREPLVHFLLIGAAIFLLYFAVTPPRSADPGFTIELTEDDLRQIDLAWIARWRRLPTTEERRGLIESKIREEILYREALKMGLDQDDAIVRRRLGQKLEFLMEDLSTLRDPTPTELQEWFKQNATQFAEPGRVTFCHVYFSPDLRGQSAQADAARKLSNLSNVSCAASEAATSGDRFPDQSYFSDRSAVEVANVFGTQFAQDIFRLGPIRWQGPVQSGLGWHLVRIEAVTPARVPAFEQVDRERIKAAWLDGQRSEAKRNSYAEMRAKYEVVLPGPHAP
jgi:hypothetical protein